MNSHTHSGPTVYSSFGSLQWCRSYFLWRKALDTLWLKLSGRYCFSYVSPADCFLLTQWTQADWGEWYIQLAPIVTVKNSLKYFLKNPSLSLMPLGRAVEYLSQTLLPKPIVPFFLSITDRSNQIIFICNCLLQNKFVSRHFFFGKEKQKQKPKNCHLHCVSLICFASTASESNTTKMGAHSMYF